VQTDVVRLDRTSPHVAGKGHLPARDDVILGPPLDPELAQRVLPEALECPIAGSRSQEVDHSVNAQASALEDQDPIGEQDGLVDVGRDQENGWTMPSAQLGHQALHREAGQGIE
jgi:hypothetical protein